MLRKALNVAGIPLPEVKEIDTLVCGEEVIIEHGVAVQKWQSLCDFGKKLRDLGENTSIATLLNDVSGIRPIDGITFMPQLTGNKYDLYSEVLSVSGEDQGTFTDGLVFESSLDGLIAAFFFKAGLPEILTRRDGFVSLGQVFIFTLDRAVEIIENHLTLEAELLNAINVPVGLRLKYNEDGTHSLHCLTFQYSHYCFFYYVVKVTDGRASAVEVRRL